MKPIIGITVDCDYKPEDNFSGGTVQLSWNYIKVIENAGGVPVLITPLTDFDEIADFIDGWLIPGGRDMDASIYGDTNCPAMRIQDPKRFEMEKGLYEASDPQMPILGICYGCQFLNVIRGGNLYKHLPDVIGSNIHHSREIQQYKIEPGSKLEHILHKTVTHGESYHHQGIHVIGKDLKIIAKHEDGTIEALEDRSNRWILAVQWHPERTSEDSDSKKIFEAFINAAKEFKQKRESTKNN